MEPEGSLPHSQVPFICPYPEPDQTSQCPHIPLPEDHLNINLPSSNPIILRICKKETQTCHPLVPYVTEECQRFPSIFPL